MNTTTASRTKGNHTVIAIIGHVDVDPTERDRLVAATAALQKATQDDEPGCVVYTISADPGASPRLTAFASRSAALPLKSSLVMLIAGVAVTVAK